MAKKLITAADVLKIKGYNMAALNGTEILGIIGEYYLTHELSDAILLRSERFVEHKDAPSKGFIDLTTLDAAISVRKECPSLFINEDSMLGCGYYCNQYPWLSFMQSESVFEHYLGGTYCKEYMDEIAENFVPTIVIDEASEDAVIKFIKSIGGYKLEKIRGKHKYLLKIV